jgi:hypothetical protein
MAVHLCAAALCLAVPSTRAWAAAYSAKFGFQRHAVAYGTTHDSLCLCKLSLRLCRCLQQEITLSPSGSGQTQQHLAPASRQLMD